MRAVTMSASSKCADAVSPLSSSSVAMACSPRFGFISCAATRVEAARNSSTGTEWLTCDHAIQQSSGASSGLGGLPLGHDLTVVCHVSANLYKCNLCVSAKSCIVMSGSVG